MRSLWKSSKPSRKLANQAARPHPKRPSSRLVSFEDMEKCYQSGFGNAMMLDINGIICFGDEVDLLQTKAS